MKEFKFAVVVPNDQAPMEMVDFLDGSQPMFDTIRVDTALDILELKPRPFFERCPISGEKMSQGDYETVAGYDNQLQVRFRTLGYANKFKNLMGIS